MILINQNVRFSHVAMQCLTCLDPNNNAQKLDTVDSDFNHML